MQWRLPSTTWRRLLFHFQFSRLFIQRNTCRLTRRLEGPLKGTARQYEILLNSIPPILCAGVSCPWIQEIIFIWLSQVARSYYLSASFSPEKGTISVGWYHISQAADESILEARTLIVRPPLDIALLTPFPLDYIGC